MFETYLMLGREREADLVREAERLHRGTRARGTRKLSSHRLGTPIVLAGLVSALVAIVLYVVVPAAAAPSAITLALSGTHPSGSTVHQGTFTAVPPLCTSGSWLGNGHGGRVFTCADGTGTFTGAFDGELEHAQGAKGPWAIFEGTGQYADLRGKGTATIDSSTPTDGTPGAPEWTFNDTWQGVVDSDPVAPSIRLGQAKATRLTTPKGWVSLRIAFTSSDNVAGNAVTYAVSYEISADAYQFGRRTGTATSSRVAVVFKLKPQKSARHVKVEIVAVDPVGNERHLVRTVKLPTPGKSGR
jgi:hypothetical protein